jgi:hypothetical protein
MSKARNLANFIGIPAINSSADATAITIDSGEKVGVGASSPQEKLHVYTTADARVEIESTTGLAAFKATNNQGSYAWYVDSSADKFHLYDFTDSANRITLDGAGKVGIGTASPGVSLDISQTNARIKVQDGTNQLNIGLWDGANYRIEGDANRKILITSYHSDGIHLGGSGSSDLVIKGNKVGIGTTSPTTALHAESSSDENKRAVRVAYNSSYYGEMVQQGAAGTLFRQYGGANFKWNSGGTDYMLLATNNLHVAGSVTANSSSVSDERFKDNIQTVTGALDKVKGLRGVTYKWNKGSRKDQTDYGVIAQEVETVMPEIVHDMTMPLLTNDEETVYKTVDYSRLSAVLINAIKELEAKVAALESK